MEAAQLDDFVFEERQLKGRVVKINPPKKVTRSLATTQKTESKWSKVENFGLCETFSSVT